MFALRHIYPFIILYSLITVDEAVATSEIRLSSYWTQYGLIVPLFLYITQFIFAPYQAGLSDHFCRRKSLIIAITATLFSLSLVGLGALFGVFLVIIGCVINGILGNTIPIARAALLDNDHKKDFRFHLGLSICFIAIGSFMPLIFNIIFSHKILFLIILIIAFFGELISLPYKDIMIGYRKGLANYKFLNETRDLKDIFKKPHFYFSWIGYALAEMSFYVYYFRFEVLKINSFLPFIPLSLGIGYLGATGLLFITKASDKTVIYIGSISAVTSACLFFISDYFIHIPYVFYIMSVFYAAGFAFFIPGLFNIVSSKEPVHKQGKIFGLIESSDTIAVILAFLSLRITTKWPLKAISFLSLLLIVVAFLFFQKVCRSDSSSSREINNSSKRL